jgi:hypothetical protein
VDDLCNGIPDEVAGIINYARGMKYDEIPDYVFLRGLLKSISEWNRFRPTELKLLDYDWEKKLIKDVILIVFNLFKRLKKRKRKN